jgi:translation elongation factor EF-4
MISNPTDFPDHGDHKVIDIHEPYVKASIISPQEYMGAMMQLCAEHRGEAFADFQYLDTSNDHEAARVLLECRLPLGEIVVNFFEQLKGRSSGFASFEWVLRVVSSRNASNHML